MAHQSHSSHAGDNHGHHITPIGTYVKVILILMFLTVLTVAVAFINMGPVLNPLIAFGIAALKAGIVALYFMGLKYDSRLNMATFLVSIVALGLLIGLSAADVFTRKESFKFHERLQIQE